MRKIINDPTVSNEKINLSSRLNTAVLIIVMILVSVILFASESIAAFDVDAKYAEAETNFRDWFNKGAGLALIIASFLWLKVGNIDYKYPAGIFGALILVNSIAELVAWFGS